MAHSRGESARAEETRLGWRMAGLAFLMSSEAAAGALIGWLVDRFAGTQPWGLLIGALLGIAVGMMSFIRGAWQLSKAMDAAGPPKGAKPLPPEPDERDKWDDDWHDDHDFEQSRDG